MIRNKCDGFEKEGLEAAEAKVGQEAATAAAAAAKVEASAKVEADAAAAKAAEESAARDRSCQEGASLQSLPCIHPESTSFSISFSVHAAGMTKKSQFCCAVPRFPSLSFRCHWW